MAVANRSKRRRTCGSGSPTTRNRKQVRIGITSGVGTGGIAADPIVYESIERSRCVCTRIQDHLRSARCIDDNIRVELAQLPRYRIAGPDVVVFGWPGELGVLDFNGAQRCANGDADFRARRARHLCASRVIPESRRIFARLWQPTRKLRQHRSTGCHRHGMIDSVFLVRTAGEPFFPGDA